MIRTATVPFQRSLTNSIQVAQGRLDVTQKQLATGKKANDLAELGGQAQRILSARTLLAAQEAQGTNATRLGTTLSLYDANISNIDASVTELRRQLLTIVGTGDTAGLQGAIDGAFGQVNAALNAGDGSGPLFAGSQEDAKPFKPNSVAETVGMTAADAFGNDDIRASARVADGLDVTYGVTASELGSGLLTVFQTLGALGPIGAKLTTAQKDALTTALGQIDDALPGIRQVNGENGRRQAQAETLATRADDRATLLKGVISEVEDADYGEIATNLQQQQAQLRASYSVFSQLSNLSLVDYIR
jgi:flagellar hook-associated protein 3 FlgL